MPIEKKTTNQKHQLDAGYVDVQATHVICDLGQGLLTPRLGVNGAGPIQFLGDGRWCPWTGGLLPILHETPPLYGAKYVCKFRPTTKKNSNQ